MSKYNLIEAEREELHTNFTYHAPKTDQIGRYGEIRDRSGLLAVFLRESCPRSRELSLAITKLEEMVFWANAAIARNE